MRIGWYDSIRRTTGMLAAVLLTALSCATHAHEIPSDVKVQAFVKPDGQKLQLLVRVPLLAMREVDVPKRGAGFLDLARADAALRTAATLWIADNIDLYEGETKLAYPRVADARVSLPSDKSFSSFDTARAHLAPEALPVEAESGFALADQLAALGAFEVGVEHEAAVLSAVRPI